MMMIVAAAGVNCKIQLSGRGDDATRSCLPACLPAVTVSHEARRGWPALPPARASDPQATASVQIRGDTYSTLACGVGHTVRASARSMRGSFF